MLVCISHVQFELQLLVKLLSTFQACLGLHLTQPWVTATFAVVFVMRFQVVLFLLMQTGPCDCTFIHTTFQLHFFLRSPEKFCMATLTLRKSIIIMSKTGLDVTGRMTRRVVYLHVMTEATL